MRIFIKKIQLLVSLSLFIFASIHFIYYVYRDFLEGPRRLKFMTWWNLYINSIYFIVVLISDICLYFNNRRMEKINFFFREHYSAICTTLTFLVSIIFWLMIYLPILITNQFSKINEMGTFYENLYVHLIITIIQILDIFFAQKTFMKFNWNHIFGLTILFLCYGIVVAIEKFVKNFSIYPFFNDLKWWNFPFFIVFFVCCYCLIYKFCYLKLIEIKYKKKIFVLESQEIPINNVESLKI